MWELFVVQDLHDSLRLDPYIRMKPLNTLHFYDSIDHEIYYGFYRYLKGKMKMKYTTKNCLQIFNVNIIQNCVSKM